MSDYDSPWKEALDRFFRLFVEFFFPEIAALIDWTIDHESLDPELQKLAPSGEVGRRHADRLVRVFRKEQGEPVLMHVELQAQEEANFPRRQYVYNYRAEDRYNQPVVSLAVLGDDNPAWRPDRYEFRLWDCVLTFSFPVVKLLDYASREEELERDANPFALLVLTHLQARATRTDPEERARWKERLLLGLYGRGLDAEDVRQWYRFIDWLLDLPEDLERRVWGAVARYEEEHKMPFVSFPERYGFQRGREEGRQEGRQEGLAEGEQKGLAEGEQKGRREGLLAGIAALLEVKFGQDGLALLPTIRQQADIGLLDQILQSLRTASDLEEVRGLLPSAPTENGEPTEGKEG
jgi:hypothetical protein